MKKLKLEELNLGNAGVLSREELKKVLGGMGSGGGSGDVMCCDKNNPQDCGICMPFDMMGSCPSGQIMGPCIYG